MTDETSVWEAEADTDLTDFSGRQAPKKLMFTLTGKCNLRCWHCVRGVFDIAAEQTPKEVVSYVVELLLPVVRAVRLGGTDLGEQLTAKHFNYFLEQILDYPDLAVEIITNLTLMDEEKAELMARACTHVFLSLEGVGEAFERNRHFPWQTVEENLRQLSAARDRIPESGMKISAFVTCFRDNLDDLLPILDLVDLGVDHFKFHPFYPNVEEQDSQSLRHYPRETRDTFARILAVASERGLEVGVPPSLAKPGHFAAKLEAEEGSGGAVLQDDGSQRAPWICPFPFETVSILSDGQVRTCCEDITFGNLGAEQSESVEMLWHGNEWRELRRSVATGEWSGACVDCGFRQTKIK